MILLLLLLMSCASEPKVYPRADLANQRLVFRGTEDGPSNQVCTKYKDQKCLVWDRVFYDLKDKDTRVRLRDAEIFCNVSGKRFRPCLDKPGLCSSELVVLERFLGIPTKKRLVEDREIVLVPQGNRKLSDSASWCASINSAIGRDMFLR